MKECLFYKKMHTFLYFISLKPFALKQVVQGTCLSPRGSGIYRDRSWKKYR